MGSQCIILMKDLDEGGPGHLVTLVVFYFSPMELLPICDFSPVFD